MELSVELTDINFIGKKGEQRQAKLDPLSSSFGYSFMCCKIRSKQTEL